MRDQPIFIDIIIKIILHRVYVNVRDRRLLTAESILRNARDLLKHFEFDGNKRPSLRIISDPCVREESRPFQLETLKKKYKLVEGILMESLNKNQEAQDAFLTCMQLGDHYFIPSMRRECIIRLNSIMLQ